MNNIFEQLAATSSRLEKEAILKKQKSNAVFKKAVFLALDPFTNFFIRKIPNYKPASRAQVSLDSVLNRLEALSSRQVTGNEAIEYLTGLLSSLSQEDARVLERVISKDLRCGVSEATINKIWPSLVPTYPCMLASGYEQKLIDKIKWPAMAQLKLDGMRFNAIVKNGTVEFRSRNGKLLNLLGHLEDQFLTLVGNDNVVVDGELCVIDGGGWLPRQIGNGILSKAQKGTLSEQEAKMVHAVVWDWIPYEDFIAGQSSMAYKTRFQSLSTTMVGEKLDRIHLVQYRMVDNIAEANQYFTDMLESGQEGIILKNLDSVWEDKRAKHQIKFKGELECDLVVVDWVEGTGKNTGRLGALVLQSSDGVIQVNVGTGFTDHNRDTIGKEVIGKIVSIKYNGRIADQKTGISSLFLPVFVEVRDDKTAADSSKSIR